MDYIKELITGNPDQDYVHQKFVKYSKGAFIGPAINVKKTGSGIKMNDSHGYVNAVIGMILKNSRGTIKVNGNVFSKAEIKTDLAGKTKKKLGIYNTEIKGEADAKVLLDIYNINKDAMFYLDLETGKAKLKTKKKAPRPGSGNDEEFFTGNLNPSLSDALMNDICFDCKNKDFKDIKITHLYQINEIVVPDEYKKDAAKARLNAKRKGTLKRKIEIDRQATETEKPLLV